MLKLLFLPVCLRQVTIKKIIKFKYIGIFVFGLGLGLLASHFAFAQELSSTNFKVLDPVVFPGSFGSSNNFRLFSVIGQIVRDDSSSANFGTIHGFLGFRAAAAVVTPTPTPTPSPGGSGGGFVITLLQSLQGQQLPRFPLATTAPAGLCSPNTDLNCDGAIDIEDLSIFLFLTPQPLPNPADFNIDSRVDVRDLSLMFFDWTQQLVFFIPDTYIETNGGLTQPARFYGGLAAIFQRPLVGSTAAISGVSVSTTSVSTATTTTTNKPASRNFLQSLVRSIAVIITKAAMFITSLFRFGQ